VKIRNELGVALLAWMFVGIVRLLFRTLTFSYREAVAGTNPFDKRTTERYLYCVWHDSVVMPAFSGEHPSTSALTSRHSDGSFVARVLKSVGIRPIRGSTNRLSPAGFRTLVRATEAGHVVITPDGPRGPARHMSVGIVYLASRTGRAIVPTAYHARSCWKFAGSWTTLVVPRPFTHVTLVAGRPIQVPPDLPRSELQYYVRQVQGEMDRVNATVEVTNMVLGLESVASMNFDSQMIDCDSQTVYSSSSPLLS
jgi:lysophospholipid acyltransferase (LPLAT)-like uncharacterized protein